MKIRICMGSSCVMLGSMTILNQLEDLKETMDLNNLEIECVKCLGNCKNNTNFGPVVEIDGEIFENAQSQDIMSRVMEEVIDK